MQRISASLGLRMVHQIMVCCLVVVCAFYCTTSVAQSPLSKILPGIESVTTQVTADKKIPLMEALDTRGDLSLQDTTIEKALFSIAASWNVNIVVGKDVKGTVSCIYHQAPLREVLDAILLANGYSYRVVGDSIVVRKTDDVGSANPLLLPESFSHYPAIESARRTSGT